MAKTTTTTAPKKKGRTPPPENETKAQLFQRLCGARVGNAVHTIELVGNCSTSQYEYTKEQAANVIKYLQDAVDLVGQQFASGGKVSAKRGISL